MEKIFVDYISDGRRIKVWGEPRTMEVFRGTIVQAVSSLDGLSDSTIDDHGGISFPLKDGITPVNMIDLVAERLKDAISEDHIIQPHYAPI